MPESRLEFVGDPDFHRPPDGLGFNVSLVLVVARSPINRVVVTRIAERCGLRTMAEEPEAAQAPLDRHRPGAVILDGGADNHECDALIPRLIDLKRSSSANLPVVILLSTAIRRPEDLHMGTVLDAVVAKPITPEGLQPTILRLLDRARADL